MLLLLNATIGFRASRWIGISAIDLRNLLDRGARYQISVRVTVHD